MVKIKSLRGPISIGHYVFVSKYSDCDPMDPWAVGFLCSYGIDGRGKFYEVDSSKYRYRHCKKITKETGDSIINEFPKIEGVI